MKYRIVLIGLLAVALFFWCGRTFAQVTGSIRGFVTDRDFNDRPLEGVTVLVVQTEQTVVSDGQGLYLIGDVPPGTYTLIFTREGFVRQVEADVLVSSGELTEVSASMPSEFNELPPLDVQELKLDAGSEIGLLEMRQDLPQFLDSVGEAQLDAAGVGDAAAALSLISGATVNDNKAVIRGLPDRYVNSQVNGVRFPSADPETRSLELDQFPTDVIESIQVSKTFTPDQQGDASGGAVNIILKGIPDEDVFKFSVGTSYNTNVTGKDDFLTYEGGGVNTFGINKGRRVLPPSNPAPVTLGTTRDSAPYNYNYNLTLAKRHEFVESGWIVGGVINTFYDQSASFYDDGIDQEYSAQFIDPDGVFARPQELFFLPNVGGTNALQAVDGREGNVFDVVKGSEQVQWGGLGAIGVENEFNKIDLIFIQSRTTKDSAVLAEDTNSRGIIEDEIAALGLTPIEKLLGGIQDPETSGGDLAYIRNQTLQYQERKVTSLQFIGSHTIPFSDEELNDEFTFRALEFDWVYALSESELLEPDQRVFQTFYNPDSASQTVFSNNFDASFTGYAQRSWEEITEESDQYQLNFKLPFALSNNEEGSFKTGIFNDAVVRTFNRDTYTTENGTQAPPSATLPGGVDFKDFFLTDLLTDSEKSVNFEDIANDVDYEGNFDIEAFYLMLEVPVTSKFRAIGGVRFESTQIGIGLTDIDLEARSVSADGTVGEKLLDSFGNRIIEPLTGLPRGDVQYQQDDVLPSLTFIYEATDALSFRTAYSQTVARMTFRELSPVRQQEFLGSDQFFGNQFLKMSDVVNYDFRTDYRPTPGGLVSFSLFYKDITDPIEYISSGNASFGGFTFPVNFKSGTLYGGELEIRQDMGEYFPELTGLSLGANATIIESEVQVNDNQITAPINQTSRPMLNAPDQLINLFAVYSNEDTGTDIGLFYTIRGDTLVAGASAQPSATGSFIPNLFETQYDTLNFTIAQKLGEHFKIKFSAKNLTDPDIQRVYRSPITPETVQSSYNKGISFSVSLSAQFEF